MADCPDISEEGKEIQEQNKVTDNFSHIEDWDGDLEEHKEIKNRQSDPQPSPKSTSTSETCTLQPSKCSVDQFGNQMSVLSTPEDSLEDIN